MLHLKPQNVLGGNRKPHTEYLTHRSDLRTPYWLDRVHKITDI